MKPWSISDFSATGKISVLTAARTRKSAAAAMRARYGRTNGSRPPSARTSRAAAAAAGSRTATGAGAGGVAAFGTAEV